MPKEHTFLLKYTTEYTTRNTQHSLLLEHVLLPLPHVNWLALTCLSPPLPQRAAEGKDSMPVTFYSGYTAWCRLCVCLKIGTEGRSKP